MSSHVTSLVAPCLPLPRERRQAPAVSAGWFVASLLSVALISMVFAGWMPLQFSIVIVFLFAGPHNWIEIRYFLTRLPGRWGKLRNYFLLGIAGVVGLAAALAALPWLGRAGEWTASEWSIASSLWMTVMIGWILLLIDRRSRQNPRRQWSWTIPIGIGFIAAAWVVPHIMMLVLVYAHPLMAFWILDRELLRSRPEWSRAYRRCLCGLPILLGILWWQLADAPSLQAATQDALSSRIMQHAGSAILPAIPDHLLVATHTFLEMLHYAVWLVAIPLISLRCSPWKLESVPMARRSFRAKRWLGVLLGAGSVAVIVLWAGFLLDYSTTRDIYFTVAVVHVLAEVPFLLRSL